MKSDRPPITWDDALLRSLNAANAKLAVVERENEALKADQQGRIKISWKQDKRIAALEKENERLRALLDKQIY